MKSVSDLCATTAARRRAVSCSGVARNPSRTERAVTVAMGIVRFLEVYDRLNVSTNDATYSRSSRCMPDLIPA